MKGRQALTCVENDNFGNVFDFLAGAYKERVTCCSHGEQGVQVVFAHAFSNSITRTLENGKSFFFDCCAIV
jgi:hypothetical protein